jgi:uncharacterized protein (TIGR02466 family)
MKIQQFYPTPIGFSSFDRKLNNTEFSFISNLSKRPNNGNETSVDSYILEHHELTDLKKFFISSCKTFIDEVYKPKAHIEPYITQSWVNFTNSAGSHHRHYHKNSFISGVFYVKVNQGQDRIKFIKDSDQILHITPREYSVFNSESWLIEVRENLLLLFPSYLDHEVPVLENNSHERISISFNTFLTGNLGSDINLDQINL